MELGERPLPFDGQRNRARDARRTSIQSRSCDPARPGDCELLSWRPRPGSGEEGLRSDSKEAVTFYRGKVGAGVPAREAGTVVPESVAHPRRERSQKIR